jgi:hypothetical protein
MHIVYTHENLTIVENARNFLLEHGIESELRNRFASGGMGELSPLQTWPEVWVQIPDYERARELITQLLASGEKPPWFCSHCGEQNDGSFEICWHCQQPPRNQQP